MCMGLAREALREIEKTRVLAGGDLRAGFETFGFSAAVWVDLADGLLLSFAGRIDEARERLVAAIRRARENDFKEILGFALNNVCQATWVLGAALPGLPDARAAAHESIEIADGLGSGYSKAMARYALALAHSAAESFEDAAASSDEALAFIRENETGREYESALLCLRGHALVALGDAASAVPIAREAMSIAGAQPCFWWGVDACRVLAQALLAHEGVAARAEIEAALAQAFAWLDESGAEALRPRVLEARAALAGALGDDEARANDLAEALRLYRAMGAEGHVARLAGGSA
jgi:tetratricopeptide (TPR) repeat protein